MNITIIGFILYFITFGFVPIGGATTNSQLGVYSVGLAPELGVYSVGLGPEASTEAVLIGPGDSSQMETDLQMYRINCFEEECPDGLLRRVFRSIDTVKVSGYLFGLPKSQTIAKALSIPLPYILKQYILRNLSKQSDEEGFVETVKNIFKDLGYKEIDFNKIPMVFVLDRHGNDLIIPLQNLMLNPDGNAKFVPSNLLE